MWLVVGLVAAAAADGGLPRALGPVQGGVAFVVLALEVGRGAVVHEPVDDAGVELPVRAVHRGPAVRVGRAAVRHRALTSTKQKQADKKTRQTKTKKT